MFRIVTAINALYLFKGVAVLSQFPFRWRGSSQPHVGLSGSVLLLNLADGKWKKLSDENVGKLTAFSITGRYQHQQCRGRWIWTGNYRHFCGPRRVGRVQKAVPNRAVLREIFSWLGKMSSPTFINAIKNNVIPWKINWSVNKSYVMVLWTWLALSTLDLQDVPGQPKTTVSRLLFLLYMLGW